MGWRPRPAFASDILQLFGPSSVPSGRISSCLGYAPVRHNQNRPFCRRGSRSFDRRCRSLQVIGAFFVVLNILLTSTTVVGILSWSGVMLSTFSVVPCLLAVSKLYPLRSAPPTPRPPGSQPWSRPHPAPINAAGLAGGTRSALLCLPYPPVRRRRRALHD